MAIKTETKVCDDCGGMYNAQKKVPNHALHIVLSFITVGFWLIVYLAAIIESAVSEWSKCPRCKKKRWWD